MNSQRAVRRTSRAGMCLLTAAALPLILCSGCDSEPSATSASATGDRPAVTNADSPLMSENESPVRFIARRMGTGIDARHFSGISEERYYPVLNGTGLAILDFDRDNRPDVVCPTGCPIPVPAESDSYETCFYRNDGDWTFRNVTNAAGGRFDGFVAGVSAADFDNDGFPDLCLSCVGTSRVYRNQGDGTFRLVNEIDLSAFSGFATGSAFADFDDDGSLDLYLCRYGEWSPDNNPWCGDRETGERAFCEPPAITPAADVLLRSLGDGRFVDVSESSTIGRSVYRSQGVIAVDINQDNRVDLYVANDGQPNCLFLNRGDFQFEETAQLTGGAYSHRGAVQGSMGLAVGDSDRDGLLDLFVTNYAGEHNTLYRSLGQAMLMDDSRSHGVVTGSVGLVGWGTAFCDLNADGWDELMMVNGHIDPRTHLLGGAAAYEQPTLIYHNRQGHFALLDEPIANADECRGSSRGLALADLDGDRDIDALFTNQDEFPGVLENVSAAIAPLSTLRLTGTGCNRDAIGGIIRVGQTPFITRLLVGGGSYLSTNSLDQSVPLAEGAASDIVIMWPGGTTAEAVRIQPGRIQLLRQSVRHPRRVDVFLIPD